MVKERRMSRSIPNRVSVMCGSAAVLDKKGAEPVWLLAIPNHSIPYKGTLVKHSLCFDTRNCVRVFMY